MDQIYSDTNDESELIIGSNSPTATQACAACKYQRRKCAPNCPLSPFFPPHRLNDFQNARKVFGVKNIVKSLRDVESAKRAIAAKTMIIEANLRVNDPAGGSCRLISRMLREIAGLEAELRLVLRQLAICRERRAALLIGPTRSKGDVVDSVLLQLEDLKPCSSSLPRDNVQNSGSTSTMIDSRKLENRFRKDCSLDESGGIIRAENEASLSCSSGYPTRLPFDNMGLRIH